MLIRLQVSRNRCAGVRDFVPTYDVTAPSRPILAHIVEFLPSFKAGKLIKCISRYIFYRCFCKKFELQVTAKYSLGCSMPLPLEEHVRLLLLENDRGQKLFKAVVDGWDAFKKEYPERHQWTRKSSSRHMMWEQVVKRLKTFAAADDGVAIVLHRDTMSLLVENEALLRLKHADTALVTQNYPTEEAQAYDDHDLELFGYTGLQRVRLCYVLDQFESKLLWVGIAAHNMGKFLWKLELDGTGAVEEPERLPLAEEETDTARLVRLKKAETESDHKKKKNG
jgi:hypothetical protein